MSSFDHMAISRISYVSYPVPDYSYVLHGMMYRVSVDLNVSGQWSEPVLKMWLQSHGVAMFRGDGCDLILSMRGLGLLSSDIRSFLSRKCRIVSIVCSRMELKCFPVFQDLPSFIGSLRSLPMFVRGEVSGREDRNSKLVVLSGMIGGHGLKLYRVSNCRPGLCSLELSSSHISEDGFDHEVCGMLGVMDGLGLPELADIRYPMGMKSSFSVSGCLIGRGRRRRCP